MTMYSKYGKRTLDIMAAAMLLIALSPLLAIIGILIRTTSPGRAIYRQVRLGYGGRPFTMYKFRSMVTGAEAGGVYSTADDPRVTAIGRWIRATSVDELPQLWNVLVGDMSFIGPRPVLPHHPKPLDEYTPAEARRFKVRPGLTGWAQIHGRKTLDWHTRLKLDGWYAENISARVDLVCAVRTLRQLLNRSENVNYHPTAIDRADQ